jgi:hypothetical protein
MHLDLEGAIFGDHLVKSELRSPWFQNKEGTLNVPWPEPHDFVNMGLLGHFEHIF